MNTNICNFPKKENKKIKRKRKKNTYNKDSLLINRFSSHKLYNNNSRFDDILIVGRFSFFLHIKEK